MSEIDVIFSAKGKAITIQPVASASSLPEKKKKKKKDKGKKRKHTDDLADDPPPPKSALTPETVIDSSALIPALKRQKVDNKALAPKSAKKAVADDDAKFTDSRGSRPR
ncbi:hypothetical protein DXG03_007883 [Asterophora parasitica]|uniref:Uncharacterized protein n=1 Tax=Asterophora parasitica TaxID=117018 RepID=A0A9P7G6H8_9AGAR|nr:hypothetical protein DXG03_007883 [Asterophora parasitica]